MRKRIANRNKKIVCKMNMVHLSDGFKRTKNKRYRNLVDPLLHTRGTAGTSVHYYVVNLKRIKWFRLKIAE